MIDANVDLEEFPDAYSKYDQAIFQYFDISDRMNNVTIWISNGFDFCEYWIIVLWFYKISEKHDLNVENYGSLLVIYVVFIFKYRYICNAFFAR